MWREWPGCYAVEGRITGIVSKGKENIDIFYNRWVNGNLDRKTCNNSLKGFYVFTQQKCINLYNPLTRGEMGDIMGDSMVGEEEGGFGVRWGEAGLMQPPPPDSWNTTSVRVGAPDSWLKCNCHSFHSWALQDCGLGGKTFETSGKRVGDLCPPTQCWVIVSHSARRLTQSKGEGTVRRRGDASCCWAAVGLGGQDGQGVRGQPAGHPTGRSYLVRWGGGQRVRRRRRRASTWSSQVSGKVWSPAASKWPFLPCRQVGQQSWSPILINHCWHCQDPDHHIHHIFMRVHTTLYKMYHHSNFQEI